VVTRVLSFEDDAHRSRLGVIAKRCYRLEAGGRATPLRDTPSVTLEPVYADVSELEDICLLADADWRCFVKPMTDVLVVGSAWSHRGPVRWLDTGIELGAVRKTVRVVGNRHIVLVGTGDLAASDAEPFEQMPLDYRRAYGGRDLGAERRASAADERSIGRPADDGGSISYVRNRIGHGFYLDVDRDRLDGAALPNLMAPDDVVTPGRILATDAYDWADRPVAAGYGPIDALTFPRCMHWFLQPLWRASSRPLAEVRTGVLDPGDLGERQPHEPPDPRYHNSAPPGQAATRLCGRERLKLWNLHPRHQLIEVDLPAEQPRLAVEPPGCRVHELEATLATVLVEPDADRLTLTWAGSMPTAAPYPDEMCHEMGHAAIWQR
jgi:hypothetical protein